MRFYCINKRQSLGFAREYLKSACQKLGVEFVEIVSEDFNILEMPLLGKQDMLYRVSTDKTSFAIEQFLLNDNVTTFYINSLEHGKSRASYLALKGSEISIPKTISVPSLNKKNIEKYVEYLGGFPIILKVVGGMRGVGVIKVDSLPALYSITDYLDTIESKYIFREFIDSSSSARLVVLNGEVIASVEYGSTGNDFRSNSRLSGTSVIEKTYDEKIQKAAIEATRLRGFAFGGVDIMIDKGGKYYVLEVNFPFGFPEVQKITGIDVAEKMICFLMNKSKKL